MKYGDRVWVKHRLERLTRQCVRSYRVHKSARDEWEIIDELGSDRSFTVAERADRERLSKIEQRARHIEFIGRRRFADLWRRKSFFLSVGDKVSILKSYLVSLHDCGRIDERVSTEGRKISIDEILYGDRPDVDKVIIVWERILREVGSKGVMA